jgi:hypothetical protein
LCVLETLRNSEHVFRIGQLGVPATAIGGCTSFCVEKGLRSTTSGFDGCAGRRGWPYVGKSESAGHVLVGAQQVDPTGHRQRTPTQLGKKNVGFITHNAAPRRLHQLVLETRLHPKPCGDHPPIRRPACLRAQRGWTPQTDSGKLPVFAEFRRRVQNQGLSGSSLPASRELDRLRLDSQRPDECLTAPRCDR